MGRFILCFIEIVDIGKSVDFSLGKRGSRGRETSTECHKYFCETVSNSGRRFNWLQYRRAAHAPYNCVEADIYTVTSIKKC